jgi:hypothetical protein
MDDSLDEVYGNALKVEVHVDTGGVSSVAFTTIVTLEDYTDRVKSVAKLVAVADLLRAALPFTVLKSEDVEFKVREIRPAIKPDGTVVTKESIVKDGQDALKSLVDQPKKG